MQTDSLVLFKKLLPGKQNNGAKRIYKRILNLAKETNYDSLTGFLANSRNLYAWRLYDESRKSRVKEYENHYTIYLRLTSNSVTIASEPPAGEDWIKIPNKTFIHVWKMGNRIAVKMTAII
jgi:hypothetical protein